MHWQITGRDRQAYSFLYDDLDRLKHGFYAEITKNDFYYNRGLYDEWSMTYDRIGNLETLNRNGAYGGCDENGQFLFQYGQIDDLIYKYDTERTHLTDIADNAGGDAALKGVRSPENAYGYDHNGNLISDTGKGMTAGYNHLNLPREVTLQSINGIDPGGIIQWTYDATGRKLKKVSPDGITLYHNGIEKAGGGTFVYHAEGRAAFYPGNPSATPPVEDKWYYEFAMRDHLGNTRITFADLNYDGYLQANPGDWIADDPHGSPVGYTEVLQENHYYPFGMNMEGPWREPEVKAKVNRYQYNGKELNSDVGLGWYNYGARMYDPVVCRFTGVDPIADQFPHVSAFNYAENSPIRNIDLHGLQALDYSAKFNKPSQKASEQIAKNVGKPMAEIGIGFTPAGVALDVYDFKVAVQERDVVGGALAAIGFLPGLGDLIKGVGKLTRGLLKSSDEVGGAAKSLTKGGDRAGKDFTQKGKQEVIDANKQKNSGQSVCEDCGTNTVSSQKSQKGVKPPGNETQVDHIYPKSKGGDGSPSNGQVLCRDCNQAKGNKSPDEHYNKNGGN